MRYFRPFESYAIFLNIPLKRILCPLLGFVEFLKELIFLKHSTLHGKESHFIWFYFLTYNHYYRKSTYIFIMYASSYQ